MTTMQRGILDVGEVANCRRSFVHVIVRARDRARDRDRVAKLET